MQTGFQVSYFKRSFSYGLHRKSFELITPQANKKTKKHTTSFPGQPAKKSGSEMGSLM